MERIKKEVQVGIAADKAFQKFVDEINKWWPNAYTWSQETLKEIRIDAKKDGLCTEIGPYGFRCDWGRVTELTKNKKIRLKWQISPNREPIPDPDQASNITIKFVEIAENETSVTLIHDNFENHGKEAKKYQKALNSPQGWEYILNCYKACCAPNK